MLCGLITVFQYYESRKYTYVYTKYCQANTRLYSKKSVGVALALTPTHPLPAGMLDQNKIK